jgi:hypothetical protein
MQKMNHPSKVAMEDGTNRMQRENPPFLYANHLFAFINTWNYKISIGVMCIKFYVNEEDA